MNTVEQSKNLPRTFQNSGAIAGQYRVLDLFSGIGGFSLGLERTGGFKTVAFCEIDPYCQRVLKKHWPDVPCYEDIRTLTGDTLQRDGIAVDVITGGFPCQDIASCGQRTGMEGEHSGLWLEYAKIIRQVRPRYAIVENVPALLVRGLSDILRDLADAGYNADWFGIPAAAIGAPHYRARQWVVAYPSGLGHLLPLDPIQSGWCSTFLRTEWHTEPDVGRVADGIPFRVDRLRALGNAVVPQIPELIGRAILRAEQELHWGNSGAENCRGL